MRRDSVLPRVMSGLLVVLISTWITVRPAAAQATFGVSGSAGKAINIGQTELAGPITLTVSSGTTVAGTVEVQVPSTRFTNEISGVSVIGTGALFGAALAGFAPDSGLAVISIPAGAGIGSSVTLSGLRLSMVGRTNTAINATLSSTGNSIIAGQNVVPIINGVVTGLVVDSSSSTSFNYVGGVLVSPPGAFIVSEGAENTFSGAVGVSGQTAATQVIFLVTGLPDNVLLTFPAVVTSDTGATLTTGSGANETITNQSNPLRVIYLFADSPTSSSTVDTFLVTPTVTENGMPGNGTTFIQAALGPIGAAIPNSFFPSLAIPRFAEQFLPGTTSPVPTTRIIQFPVPAATTGYSQVIANTASGAASAIIRARAADGNLVTVSNVNAETALTLSGGQTVQSSLTQLFGSAASTQNIASVEVESPNTRLIGTGLASAAGGRAAIEFPRVNTETYLPFDRKDSAELPGIEVLSRASDTQTLNFTLRSATGQSVATTSKTVSVSGAIKDTLAGLFAVQPGALPLSGFVIIQSATPFSAVLFNNPSARSDAVTNSTSIPRSPMIFPFYAFGGGYSSVLTLINASQTQSARVTVAPYDPSGSPLTGTTSVVRTIDLQQRADLDIGALFGTGSVVKVGFLVITTEQTNPNPFAGIPPIYGAMRITIGQASTVVPLVTDAGTEFFITPTVETPAQYTGLAIVNDGSSAVTVTVEVHGPAGGLLGSTTFPLTGNAERIQLLRELVPASLNQDGGFVRISSTGGAVNVAAFRGNMTLTELLYLRPQVLQ